MNDFILISYRGIGRAKEEFPAYMIAIAFFGPLILGLAYFLYIRRFNSKWDKGIFPDKLPFNRDNLLEAYICFAALMLQKDKRDYREKLKFINGYFTKHFPDNSYNFAEILTWRYKNPINPKTVAVWVNRHVKEETKRMQILYFLVGLSFVDGQLIQDEYAVLKEITPLLNLKIKDLDAIVNMYNFEEEKKKTKYSQSTTSSYSSSYKKEMALKILGLESNSSADDLKSAYRKLVKIHHPDRFSNESQEQQALAHEKFLKIQEAYEYLEKVL